MSQIAGLCQSADLVLWGLLGACSCSGCWEEVRLLSVCGESVCNQGSHPEGNLCACILQW